MVLIRPKPKQSKDMEVQAITKNIRMSAQKMREVVRQIQGLGAEHAQAVLAVVPRKGARVVAKTLKSAIANAEDLKTHKKEYSGMMTERLRIKEAVAQTASTLRRFTPKARGSAGPILKRNCHIKIILTDQ
jgi:large subunit ribosomal protein L22